jgi:hypothetical protein
MWDTRAAISHLCHSSNLLEFPCINEPLTQIARLGLEEKGIVATFRSLTDHALLARIDINRGIPQFHLTLLGLRAPVL